MMIAAAVVPLPQSLSEPLFAAGRAAPEGISVNLSAADLLYIVGTAANVFGAFHVVRRRGGPKE